MSSTNQGVRKENFTVTSPHTELMTSSGAAALCEEFLQLEVQELAHILGQENLTVTKESKVYESVLRWIKHKPEERQGAIATLLPKVRLGLMNKRYIRHNVLHNDLVKTNPESHLLVYNTLQVMSRPSLLRSEPGIDNTLFCRRLPNAVLLMIRFISGTIEAFDYVTNSWITVNDYHNSLAPLIPSFFVSTVFLGGYLYIVGGVLKWNDRHDRVWRFNLVSHTWQEVSPLLVSRELMSVAVLKRCIYALGGFSFHDDESSLRSAERYQSDTNQWTFIASMNEERFDASCTTLNNKIYICGGFHLRVLDTAECYNPDTNQWTVISPMGTPRNELGVVAYMGHIFAVGGRNGSRYLRSAEAYDPVTNTWHDVPEMVHSHRYFGIAVMNKQIFVVSCRDRKKIIECYNSTTNSWSVVFSSNNNRFSVGCCVISGLPNMAEYCSPREPVITRRRQKEKV
uniref:BACK domain-containing protein n=1 Tax=Gouania willdenowi TaxID=441366 RepID=A0A8C5N9R3_GOUWI